jgi:hypothetical protein
MSGQQQHTGESNEFVGYSYTQSRGIVHSTGTCWTEGEADARSISTSSGRSYSYGGPPELVRRWLLRDLLLDYRAEEHDEAVISAINRLLALL